jgi:hypothetical protein
LRCKLLAMGELRHASLRAHSSLSSQSTASSEVLKVSPSGNPSDLSRCKPGHFAGFNE